jgi:repressor of nif and glnA expression
MIEGILQTAAPRALRQAEIRKALQEKGVELAFTSIRHALSQLEARNAAEQVGDSKTWRHRTGPS